LTEKKGKKKGKVKKKNLYIYNNNIYIASERNSFVQIKKTSQIRNKQVRRMRSRLKSPHVALLYECCVKKKKNLTKILIIQIIYIITCIIYIIRKKQRNMIDAKLSEYLNEQGKHHRKRKKKKKFFFKS
jgi:hypothetical protein